MNRIRSINSPDEYSGDSYGIVLAGHFHEGEHYATSRPQGMGDWLITYTLSGEGCFRTPGSELRCKAGEITLLKAGTPHQYGTAPGGSWHFVWAHFATGRMDLSLLPEEELYNQHVSNETARKRIYRAFKRILSDSTERGDYWHELCIHSLHEVLILLAQSRQQRIDGRVEETLHRLSQSLREPVRIEALAAAVGLSPSRLSHLFKESTGQSMIDALNQMRIGQAALLMEHTDRSAADIAYDTGFSNYNHFINQFHKRLGMSPSDYRKQKRSKP
ncbi:helix-turn-helix domain-containing protein [Paenibacillus sp. GCM10023252]|uniref:helix-turn-helix domain-containing protein n=1 Tax=Paenibacillus sp. GCM10023252 TaxID=3252649 RepID=UPI00360FEDFE